MNNKLIAIFGVLFVLVLGLAASAAVPNPQQRACQQTGGLVHNARLAAPVNDEVLFCEYGPSVLVDALSVMSALESRSYSLAMKAYISTKVNDFNSCEHSSGIVLRGNDLEGTPFVFCRFSDGSAVELSTLSRGINDLNNANLNQALGL